MTEIHVLGVPFNSGGTPPEIENPPQSLRDAGLIVRLGLTRKVHDCGDLPIPKADGLRHESTYVLNWPSWQSVTNSVAESVHQVLITGGWPLVIGGDCSILVGALAGAADAGGPGALFFVDGHGDFHTPATSPTGEAADMELASLTGRAPNPFGEGTGPLLEDRDIVAFGIRELDGIDAAPIQVYDFERLAQNDFLSAVQEGAALLSEKPAWLHFDVDVLDPALMPVLFPAGNGLTWDQTRALLGVLLETGGVVGMSVACFHPDLDHNGTATLGLIDLLSDVLEG